MNTPFGLTDHIWCKMWHDKVSHWCVGIFFLQLTVVQRSLPPDMKQPLGQQAAEGKARMQHTRVLDYKLVENGVRLTSRLVSRRPGR